MQKILRSLVPAAGALLLALPAGARDVQTWDLEGITRIELDGTSGDVVLLPAEGRKPMVELTASVVPEEGFRPEADRRGDVLELQEHWRGSHSSGKVTWRIYIAKSQQPVQFSGSTASGNLEAADVSASIRFRTASGQLELSKVTLGGGSSLNTASGDVVLSDMTVEEDVKFSTASGDVTLERITAAGGGQFSTASGQVRARACRGALHLNSASGDVAVHDCELTGESSFSTASGDVAVVLARMPEHDLRVSSASGDAELGIGEWGESFRLVLEKRKNRGRLACPFPFTAEEEYEKDDHIYVEKTVERGSGGPEILVRSHAGDVIVRR